MLVIRPVGHFGRPVRYRSSSSVFVSRASIALPPAETNAGILSPTRIPTRNVRFDSIPSMNWMLPPRRTINWTVSPTVCCNSTSASCACFLMSCVEKASALRSESAGPSRYWRSWSWAAKPRKASAESNRCAVEGATSSCSAAAFTDSDPWSRICISSSSARSTDSTGEDFVSMLKSCHIAIAPADSPRDRDHRGSAGSPARATRCSAVNHRTTGRLPAH